MDAGFLDAVTVTDWSEEDLASSAYVRPRRLRFRYRHGPSVDRMRTWDVCDCHDAVCCLLYHVERDALVFVRQFRAPVFRRMVRDSKAGEEAPRAAEAFTYELCAGIVDKDASLSRIAKEEILEECGFDVPEDSLEKVVSYRAAVGILGYNTTMFYAEVSEAQRVHQGGGIHDEDIQVVYVPVDECEKFVLQDPSPKPSGIIMAVLWFLKVKNRNVS